MCTDNDSCAILRVVTLKKKIVLCERLQRYVTIPLLHEFKLLYINIDSMYIPIVDDGSPADGIVWSEDGLKEDDRYDSCHRNRFLYSDAG